MSEKLSLPVLPLRDMVLFPGVTAPVGAGRAATLHAIETALKSPSRRIFAVMQRENVDLVSPAGLHGFGTVARIGQVQLETADVFTASVLRRPLQKCSK